MEFTSAGIIDPIRDSGERITNLTIFKREKIGGSTGKSKFGSQVMNHFVSGLRGMMENNEAVQRVYNDMILVGTHFFRRKECIDFFLVVIKFRGVEPRIRRVGGIGVFIKSKCFQNRMPSPDKSPWKGRGITRDRRKVPLRKGSHKTIEGVSFCVSKAHITFVNKRGG